jgi:hypothetical protein
MDHEVLVKEAQLLTLALDKTRVAPRAVMIALSSETGNWKLWIVPKDDTINKQEFYRIVAEQISSSGLKNIEVGAVELYRSTNPAILGLSRFIRSEGIGSAYLTNNSVNGMLLPNGIVVRLAV